MSLGDAKNAVQYHQMFHYSNLGNSVLEILLSPFTRSAVFFRELFAVENFYFALILFAGFPAIWFYPKLLILTVLPFVGVFLLNNNDLSNVAMQYQLEIFLVLVAASVSGLAVMQQRSQKHLTTILLASLFALTVCGCFMGRLPWGGYSGMPAEKSCCLKKIALIKQVIPGGCKNQTTLAYQSHFIGRNIMCNFSENKIDPDADFIILPERDLFLRSENIAALVKQIIYSNKWKITAIDPEIHRVLVVERIK